MKTQTKRLLSLLSVGLILCLVLSGCSNSGKTPSGAQANNSDSGQKKEIIIMAAASLKGALTEIETDYESKNSGIDLTFSFASSGTLQQQIEQGAPADVFVSAGKKQMDALEDGNLLVSGTRLDLLGNDLVLIVGKDNTTITRFEDLSKASKIGMGTPESVPAGKYAKESLTHMGLYDQLQSKLVLAKDVNQVLTYVESGNVDAGFVYTSDAMSSDKVKTVATAPAESHSAITYPGAVIAASKNQTEAKAFLDYLSSSEAKTIFKAYGFK
ncbi:molybdate ABC transporter substrate-binding protein [Dehalobacter sp. DCM]|uniref:molybdate ABC transporter substrate-binding protein n=1 Tax=Dehalobacter sp. DCM TaxID=2907827 RepID=UPI00308166CA|nr:molybdate ABC transporter substrate-binding protein [Dehalobacter sp. DCM]